MSTSPSAAHPGPRVLTHEAWGEDPRRDSPLHERAATVVVAAGRPPRTRSPVETTAALLRGRFTALVIWHLFWGGKRFYQLVRELEGVPRKALAHELDELERAGIVGRRVRDRGQGKVEYELTPRGETLKIVVGAMYEWGLLARHTPGSGSCAADLDEASL